MYGYWGKLLRVDLTNQTYQAEDISEDLFRKYIGGAAFGAKILLEETPAKVDPLSPENKLIFAVGPLQGVNFPGNGKWSVISWIRQEPVTGLPILRKPVTI
jgi:aldehyde:ferredoxin oxidoreductase